MCILENKVLQFLQKYQESKKTSLLALSGGPDSLALFFTLLRLQKKEQISFAVAHVDHCWRESSTKEALALKKLCEENHVVFHLKTLDPKLLKGNLEESCRKERLKFFKELCFKNHYQAVLLAHHADDQVETVLKRIFEGSSLEALKGMEEVSLYEGLSLWRPFLNFKKESLVEELKEEDFKAVIDSTNENEKYLRARMRKSIFPFLNETFGKEISCNIQKLAKEMKEVHSYIESKVEHLLKQVIIGPFGLALDLSENTPLEPVEIKMVIKKMATMQKVALSQSLIEKACDLLQKRKANCQLLCKTGVLEIDRGRLFVMSSPLESFEGKFNFKEEFQSKYLKFSVRKYLEGESFFKSGWQEIWKGNTSVALPQGEYYLAEATNQLSKFFNNAKVPAFMRKLFPVVYQGEKPIAEFLTGRKLLGKKNDSRDENLDILLEAVIIDVLR